MRIRAGGMAQMVEWLPSKNETLSSNPNTGKRKREKERERENFYILMKLSVTVSIYIESFYMYRK
jgi:hypothetical protein